MRWCRVYWVKCLAHSNPQPIRHCHCDDHTHPNSQCYTHAIGINDHVGDQLGDGDGDAFHHILNNDLAIWVSDRNSKRLSICDSHRLSHSIRYLNRHPIRDLVDLTECYNTTELDTVSNCYPNDILFQLNHPNYIRILVSDTIAIPVGVAFSI